MVWVEAANGFDVIEEAGWNCVVVERFVGIRGAAIQVDALFIFGPKSILVLQLRSE